jgi:hypothetical protein
VVWTAVQVGAIILLGRPLRHEEELLLLWDKLGEHVRVIIDLVGMVSAVVSRVYALCALSLLFVTLPRPMAPRQATLSNSAEGSGPSSSRGRGKVWQGDPVKTTLDPVRRKRF